MMIKTILNSKLRGGGGQLVAITVSSFLGQGTEDRELQEVRSHPDTVALIQTTQVRTGGKCDKQHLGGSTAKSYSRDTRTQFLPINAIASDYCSYVWETRA